MGAIDKDNAKGAMKNVGGVVARVTVADADRSNGVIHVLDSQWLPAM